MELALIVLVIAVALSFDYTGGLHAAAYTIATPVSTRALTPRVALVMAAVFTLVGALLGEGVARTIGSETISPGEGQRGLVIVLTGLLGAIAWNLLTWWRGLPSSSAHALVGGLAGSALAAASTVHWDVVVSRVVVPMVAFPLVGFGLAYLLMVAITWSCRNAVPGRTNRRFKIAQTVSAAAMALGHGLQDAQKTMGVIVLALVAGGYQEGDDVPLWVTFCAALAISAGTYAGGWRIVRTLGRRIVDLDPPRGFAAETVAASVLYTTAFAFQAPISTTHTITSAVIGVGATRGRCAVRWGVVREILIAWVLTVPMAGLSAALFYAVANLLLG